MAISPRRSICVRRGHMLPRFAATLLSGQRFQQGSLLFCCYPLRAKHPAFPTVGQNGLLSGRSGARTLSSKSLANYRAMVGKITSQFDMPLKYYVGQRTIRPTSLSIVSLPS